MPDPSRRAPFFGAAAPFLSAADFSAPPHGLISAARDLPEASALLLIWGRETSRFERAWLHRLCAQGDRDSALSWLAHDEALSEIFGLCPANAAGRVWDRLARASGLRQVSGGRGRPADERCQRLARAAGAHQLFPPDRRERLRLSLWSQARQDASPSGSPALGERFLPWPPPADRLEAWLEACRDRADETRSQSALACSLLAQEALDRAGFPIRSL